MTNISPMIEEAPLINSFLQVPSCITIPLAFAAWVYATFKLLAQSKPLQDAALEWLTSPNQRATIQKQYVIVQEKIFGSGLFTLKRNLSISAIFLIVFIGLFWLKDYDFRESDDEKLIKAAVYAMFYFQMWNDSPIRSASFLVVAFIGAHACFAAFHRTTLETSKFGDNIVKYLAILALIYMVISIAAVSITSGMVAIFASDELDWSTIYIVFVRFLPWNAIGELAHHSHNLRFGENTSNLDKIIAYVYILSVVGTTSIWMTAIIGATIINIVYAAALAALRLDFFLQNRYRWNHSNIISQPMFYMGIIASFITFMSLTILCLLGGIFLALI